MVTGVFSPRVKPCFLSEPSKPAVKPFASLGFSEALRAVKVRWRSGTATQAISSAGGRTQATNSGASSHPSGTSKATPNLSSVRVVGDAIAAIARNASAQMGAFMPGLFCELRETAADEVPVDDVLEGLHVIRAPILIFQVISVLPHIDPEQGRGAG